MISRESLRIFLSLKINHIIQHFEKTAINGHVHLLIQELILFSLSVYFMEFRFYRLIKRRNVC
jgi:hypothetical protein